MKSAAKSKNPPPAKAWFVYILRCSNGALYTGIATDVNKRLAVHNAGKGSAYVRANRPAALVAFITAKNRSAASILECQVKALSRSQKLALAGRWKAALKQVQAKRTSAQTRKLPARRSTKVKTRSAD